MSPDFLHMVIVQRKDKSVTNIFSWVWLGIPNHTKVVETFYGKGSSEGWSKIMDSSKSTIRFYFRISRGAIFLNWSKDLGFFKLIIFTKRSEQSGNSLLV